MQLEGSAAIVFGDASGLGEAAARRLATAGAKVFVADLAADRVAAVAEEIGGVPLSADVTDPGSVEAAVTEASTAPGRLRISVNCAGVGTPGKLIRKGKPEPLESFAKIIEVNLLGTINVLRCVAGSMIGNDPDSGGERGVCVNTASVAAFEGQVGQVAYAASKGGVVGLTLPVARELAPSGVRVVAIAPGLFDTPMMAALPPAARDSLGGTVPFPHRLGYPAEYGLLVEQIVVNPMLNGETIRLDGALRMGPS
jgi:NAD(P)-dependent dehydrogenase (short-subunit alcohol dehydrogenase family)